MDGFELACRIADSRADRRPRLVALTGYGREGDIERTRAVGFDGHLVKPVNLSLLVSAIEARETAASPVGHWSKVSA